MCILTIIYLIFLQENVTVTAFNKINIWTLPDSTVFEIREDSLILRRANYAPFYVKLDSSKSYKRINEQIFLGIDKLISNKNKLLIENYLLGEKSYKLRLNELRTDKSLHDFMFYFAGMERAHYKEYFKSFYNFNKAYELGVRTPLLKSEINRITKIINKIFKYNENKSSVNSIPIVWQIHKKKNNENVYLSYINEVIYGFGCLLLITFLFKRKNKKKTSLIKELTKEKIEEPVIVQKTYPPKNNANKTLEITEKKKRLLDVIEQSKNSVKKIEPITEDFVEDTTYFDDDFEKKSLFETEHINQNIGEVELALNLQSIKRKYDTASSKYDDILELRNQNLSIEDIAKRLNITVTEVKLFFSFKDKN